MSRGRPMISIRIDQAKIDRIKRIAAEKNTSFAELVREVIERWLEEQTET